MEDFPPTVRILTVLAFAGVLEGACFRDRVTWVKDLPSRLHCLHSRGKMEGTSGTAETEV